MTSEQLYEIQSTHVALIQLTGKLLECADEVKKEHRKMLRLLDEICPRDDSYKNN